MVNEISAAAVYSSPRIEVLEADLRCDLLEGSIPLEGGTPGGDLMPGGDYNL